MAGNCAGACQPRPWNALGFLKAESGHLAEAERSYRQALANDPHFFAARHNLAVLISAHPARRRDAIELWDQVLAEAPDFLPSRISLAEELVRTGQNAEAILEFEKIVGSRPDYLAGRMALADLYLKSGNYPEARAHIREALSRNSN